MGIFLTVTGVLILIVYIALKSIFKVPQPLPKINTTHTETENRHVISVEAELHQEIKPIVVTKNKWLYPDNEFGVLEPGTKIDTPL